MAWYLPWQSFPPHRQMSSCYRITRTPCFSLLLPLPFFFLLPLFFLSLLLPPSLLLSSFPPSLHFCFSPSLFPSSLFFRHMGSRRGLLTLGKTGVRLNILKPCDRDFPGSFQTNPIIAFVLVMGDCGFWGSPIILTVGFLGLYRAGEGAGI